jgi:hypothetical protein
MRLLPFVLLAAACQEYTVDKIPVDPVEQEDPPETDVPVPETEPDIEVDTTQLDFGTMQVDCEAEPQRVTITNVGDADLDVSDVTLDGPDAALYTLSVVPQTLAPGESMRATVRFLPTGFDSYNEVRLQIFSNDPDESTVNVRLEGEGAENASWDQSWTQVQAGAVDVLFVIDNSGSMSDNINRLNNTFRTFIQQFDLLGLDYHIAVTTTDMDRPDRGEFVGPVITSRDPDPVQAFINQTDQGAAGSGDERGRDAAYAALTAPLINGPNAGFLRTNANLAIAVISDEDDFSSNVTVQAFNSWLNNLKGDPAMTSFSGMVGPDGGGGLIPGIACSIASGDVTTAPRYHDLINGTRGVWGDLCNYQYQPFLTFLSFVAAGLIYEFPLDYTPDPWGQIAVTVDNQPVAYGTFDGWSYDAATNSVLLNGDAIPDPGTTIVITYPYATECETP